MLAKLLRKLHWSRSVYTARIAAIVVAGLSQDCILVSGAFTGGWTSLTYTRKVNTGDSANDIVFLNQAMPASYAWYAASLASRFLLFVACSFSLLRFASFLTFVLDSAHSCPDCARFRSCPLLYRAPISATNLQAGAVSSSLPLSLSDSLAATRHRSDANVNAPSYNQHSNTGLLTVNLFTGAASTVPKSNIDPGLVM